MTDKQVDKSHYAFANYLIKGRWASMWHQLDEVFAAAPGRVLEFGPGPGILKAVAGLYGVRVETVDIDPALEPDHLIEGTDTGFPAASYDVVCAFQMLEHVPYEQALELFAEMQRVAATGVVISLPDARPAWPYSIHLPFFGDWCFALPRPWTGPKAHAFDGEHWWEVNKKGYELDRVKGDLEAAGPMRLQRTYRVSDYPYHRYFVFRR